MNLIVDELTGREKLASSLPVHKEDVTALDGGATGYLGNPITARNGSFAEAGNKAQLAHTWLRGYTGQSHETASNTPIQQDAY